MSQKNEIPRHRQSPDQRDQQDAIQAELDRERAEVGLPPERVVEMSPAQKTALERERQALLEAIAPIKKQPTGPEAQRRVTVIIRPVEVDAQAVADAQAASEAVDAALAEQARLLQVVHDAKRDLEAANLKVDQAREKAQAQSYEHAHAAAAEQLRPVAEQVVGQRDALQAIHNQYGHALKDYAKSIAAGPLVRRSALQARYNAAAPLAQRLALAFKAAEEAIRLLNKVNGSGSEGLRFSVSAAVTASEAALAHDASKIREDCAALVAAVTAWRGPGVPLTQDPAWRPGMGRGSDGPDIDTTWTK